MSDDIGWQFLNNSDGNVDFDPNDDGSWGFIDVNGNGAYYGADGSWGYRNEDGTAYFYGSDGSWGYKNKDGSGSYFGDNGSWGYTDTEGNGSYFDSEGNIEVLSNANSHAPTFVSTVYPKQNLLTSQYNRKTVDSNSSIYNDRYESEVSRTKDEELINDKLDGTKTGFIKRYWRGLLFILVISIMLTIGLIERYRNMIEIDFTEQEIIGINYEDAMVILSEAGFTNVVTSVYDDLTIDELPQENCVTSIKLRGNRKLSDVRKYPIDAEIVVVYHVLKKIAIPYSSKEFKKMEYSDAREKLEKAGFINIDLVPEHDLLLGVIKKEGIVKSISIKGEDKFEVGDFYRPDEEIVIHFHSKE